MKHLLLCLTFLLSTVLPAQSDFISSKDFEIVLSDFLRVPIDYNGNETYRLKYYYLDIEPLEVHEDFVDSNPHHRIFTGGALSMSGPLQFAGCTDDSIYARYRTRDYVLLIPFKKGNDVHIKFKGEEYWQRLN